MKEPFNWSFDFPAKSQEPKAKSQEPKAKSQEFGVEGLPDETIISEFIGNS